MENQFKLFDQVDGSSIQNKQKNLSLITFVLSQTEPTRGIMAFS